jgi:phosphoglycolate phosphatase
MLISPHDPARSYDAVIFDFDGTLADSFAWFLAALAEVAPRHGFRAPRAHELDSLRGMAPAVLMRKLGIAPLQVAPLALRLRRRMASELDRIALFEGVPALLEALRRFGIRTAIVTSNSRPNVEHLLGRKHASMIDHYGCNAALLGKRRKLRAACTALGVPRVRVLCVGDELRDADAAEAEGLAFAAVGWGFARADVLAPHSVVAPLHDVNALRALLLGAD